MALVNAEWRWNGLLCMHANGNRNALETVSLEEQGREREIGCERFFFRLFNDCVKHMLSCRTVCATTFDMRWKTSFWNMPHIHLKMSIPTEIAKHDVCFSFPLYNMNADAFRMHMLNRVHEARRFQLCRFYMLRTELNISLSFKSSRSFLLLKKKHPLER